MYTSMDNHTCWSNEYTVIHTWSYSVVYRYYEVATMNEDELELMNEGTQARYMNEFDEWSIEDKEEYWALVKKFAQTYPQYH